MIFEYIDGSNCKKELALGSQMQCEDTFMRCDTSSKLAFIKEFVPAYTAGQRLVLFDTNHKQLVAFHEKNDIYKLKNAHKLPQDTQLLFFTSGSSGFPVGAFKTKENLVKEVAVLRELVMQKEIRKVVVTVPFIHIYGILAGLLLPMSLGDVRLVVKEDFLPYELLEEAKTGQTLVVTTPVFIKALGKLNETIDLGSNMFISSTGPLSSEDVAVFEQRYGTDVMQLFGSTETGGIAYKFGTSREWLPLASVSVQSLHEKLSVRSPFISEYLLEDGITKLAQPFVTEDIIEYKEKGFILLGRSNKLIKIAGKRISALAIETLLESLDGVEHAVVSLVYKKELLRSEQILITLQAKEVLKKSYIKGKINECYGVLTIPFKVVYVDKIQLSAMGKKVLFS